MNKIKLLRKKYHLSQNILSNILEISLYKYQKLERGSDSLTEAQIKTLIKFFNVDENFFDEENNKNDSLNEIEKKRINIIKEINNLPDIVLPELNVFINYLKYKSKM